MACVRAMNEGCAEDVAAASVCSSCTVAASLMVAAFPDVGKVLVWRTGLIR